MNIELLKEIKELRENDLSDTDIASSLGLSKANILLMLRIEKVVKEDIESKSFFNDEKVKSLENSISSIQKDLDSKNFEVLNLKSELDDLKSDDLFLKFEELEKEFSILEKDYFDLQKNLEIMPDFIKKLFLKE